MKSIETESRNIMSTYETSKLDEPLSCSDNDKDKARMEEMLERMNFPIGTTKLKRRTQLRTRNALRTVQEVCRMERFQLRTNHPMRTNRQERTSPPGRTNLRRWTNLLRGTNLLMWIYLLISQSLDDWLPHQL